MNIHLAYGKQGLDINVPDRNLAGVLSMRPVPAIEHPGDELWRALAAPIASPPLSTLAAGVKSACVVISDITRPVPNMLILPPILETLERNGIPHERVTILIATGLHRPSTVEERRRMLGPEILSKYRVVDHHARDEREQTLLGTTVNNTPVYIDRKYCEADLKITTGFIEPHLMAGFSGGRKLVAPGCAGERTIKALHSPFFLENPLCREGSIEKNPLHHELLEIARLAGHDFIVNVAMDASGKVTGIFAGNPVEAHAAGVGHVRTAVLATLGAPVDIAVTTGAGYPLDLTYYQAIKGITAALPVVKEGGMLIIAAECAEGLGSPEFVKMATSYSTADAFVRTIMRDPVVIDQWQLEECAKAARRADVVLVSGGIPEDHRNSLFVRTADSVEAAIREGFARYGPDATVAVIPKGPYTLVGIEQ